MNRSEWNYWRYLWEVVVGMLTAWARTTWYWRELLEGLKALGFIIALLLLPLLLPGAPLFALLSRASDRRDARQIEKLRAEARARVRSWGNV